MAMYLLVGSPVPSTLIDPQPPELTAERRQRYALEQQRIDGFKAGLGGAARVFAHLSCLMIFDDHDITDDWNLSAQWEETAYGHPFSKRIIGNALIAYMLRSEEHTSELQSLMRISYAVFCLKKKKKNIKIYNIRLKYHTLPNHHN